MIIEQYLWDEGNKAMIFEKENLSIKLETILPDSGEFWHFHKKMKQWFLPLRGDLSIVTHYETKILSQEQVVFIPPIKAHKVWNNSKQPCQFYLISYPPNSDHDKFVLEWEYPKIDTLLFQDENFQVKVLREDDEVKFRSLLQKNKQRLLKHFPTSYVLKTNDISVLSYLRERKVTPFGLFLNNELIGYISLKNENRFRYSSEVAFWIDSDYESNGIMENVLVPFIEMLFLDGGLRFIEAKVHSDYNSSASLLNRSGFKPIYQSDGLSCFELSAKNFLLNSNYIKVLEHQKGMETYFTDLNVEWVQELFEMEEPDKKVLYHPIDKILKPGGQIFYVLYKGVVVSTGAMMPLDTGEFELTKMATTMKYQGLGFGELIIKKAIEWSRKKKLSEIILYTQSTLFKAIKLYERNGFERLNMDRVQYKRADTKMRLKL